MLSEVKASVAVQLWPSFFWYVTPCTLAYRGGGGQPALPEIPKPIFSAPEYGRSSVDLTYRSVGTTERDSQENSH